MLSPRQLFLSQLAQTSDFPLMLEIKKAKGIYLYDTSGKEYMDLISGISVNGLGHHHPRIVEAIKKQADRYLHTMVYGEYIQSPQIEFSKLLTDHLPKNLQSVYFVNSGTEAAEGAMKLAKRFTGRPEIIYFENAYHGSTQGALSVMGNEYFKNAYRPLLPGTKQISINSFDDLEKITGSTAAVIIETIQGEAGVIIPEMKWMKALRKKCDETGALLILDEIQTGMGRTGTLFAFEQYKIKPDILLLAKSLGGGMPLGAFISSREIMSSLKSNPVLGHITTFGGHPVCCAAGMAGMTALLKSKLISQVKAKEQLFLKLLKHPLIKEVRSFGLMLAVEMEFPEIIKKVITRCIEKGIITDWFLFAENCLRIAPPLIIKEKEIQKACRVILESIEAVHE